MAARSDRWPSLRRVSQQPAARDALPADYPQFLEEVKRAVARARSRAALAVSAAVLAAYWEIGSGILAREEREGWGAKVVDRLAADLRRAFPDMTGLSPRNLRYMREFARQWPAASADEMLQQPAARLPWTHHIILLDKLDDPAERVWYATADAQQGWSRKVLAAQIESDLRGRRGAALTSFSHALPAPESELVRDALKDPYNFEFLSLSADAKERDLEAALLNDVEKFLMEMGRGFALAGRQFPLRVVDEETGAEAEFFVDLLFYNYILRRFVVVDLKIEDFKPEFAGKMHFYLNAVDELERQPDDAPTIGLVLCPGRNKTVTQWALRGIETPVAVARYTTGEVTMTDATPATLRPALPELPDLATELADITDAANILYDEDLREEDR
jgi:predicted nuclease of restriction endonuclease-like (RecB) superfamily